MRPEQDTDNAARRRTRQIIVKGSPSQETQLFLKQLVVI